MTLRIFDPTPIKLVEGELFVNGEARKFEEIEKILLDRIHLPKSEAYSNFSPKYVAIGRFLVNELPLEAESKSFLSGVIDEPTHFSSRQKLVLQFSDCTASCTLEFREHLFSKLIAILIHHKLIEEDDFEREMARQSFGYRTVLYPPGGDEDIDFHSEFSKLLAIGKSSLTASGKPIRSDVVALVNSMKTITGHVHYESIETIWLNRQWRLGFVVDLEIATDNGQILHVSYEEFYQFINALDQLQKKNLINLQDFYYRMVEGPGPSALLYSR